MTRKTIPALDGIRALAIGLVILNHFWGYPAGAPFVGKVITKFAVAGWLGVDLFFVLSGFLITRTLIAHANRPDYYRAFYSRRVRRIVPIYYLVLLIVLLGLPLLGPTPGVMAARHDWLWYVAFLSNARIAQVGWQVLALNVTWSLAVEEQFYLAWPAALRRLGTARLATLCVALALVLPLVRIALVETRAIGIAWIDLFTVFRIDSLAVGAFMACVEPRLPTFGTRSRLAYSASACAVLFLIAHSDMDRTGTVTIAVGHSLIALMSAFMIYAALTERSWTARVLSLTPLRKIGKVSYGLYLYHAVVLVVVARALTRVGGFDIDHLSSNAMTASVLKLTLLSACSYVVASLSFRYFEEPILHGVSVSRILVGWRSRALSPAERIWISDLGMPEPGVIGGSTAAHDQDASRPAS